MRRVKIEVYGDQENYACITAYLWLLEISPMIADELNVQVEVDWNEKLSFDYEPIILIDEEIVFEGLPSEAGYLYEVIKSFLNKKLNS